MSLTPGLKAEAQLFGVGPKRLPRWAYLLAEVLYNTPPKSESILFGVPFEQILWPFLYYARKQFIAEVQHNFSVDAIAEIERELLEHLSLTASWALGRIFYEYRFRCAPLAAFEKIWTQQHESTEIFSSFIIYMQSYGLVKMFERYPVLGRLMAQSVDLFIDALVRLCRRFTTDWPQLRKMFGWKEAKSEGIIIGIKTGLSDRHMGGQTVVRLSLVNGYSIIYKPRSVSPEIVFNKFLDWLNCQGLSIKLKTVRALDQGTYGWMEFVPYHTCDNASEVERFYIRAGMLLAVLHILAVTDIHCENLIASGEHPVVIDLETLLSESPRRRVSVLDTGFLPRWHRSNDLPNDTSALGADPKPKSNLRFPIWRQSNTDQMNFSEDIVHSNEFHRVKMGDQMPNVAEYLSSFRLGFRMAYERILSRWRKLEQVMSLKSFDGLELRVLLRDSATYSHLHLHLLHPEFLEDDLDRSIELEWLARPLCTRTKTSRGRVMIYELERMAMEKLDIPYFKISTWIAMQHKETSEEVQAFGIKRDSHTLRKRLERISKTACRSQLALITRSICLKYPLESKRN